MTDIADKRPNAIVYYTKDHKMINGTLFYCFEYFIFLKRYIPELVFVVCNADDRDLTSYREIFLDKYTFPENYLEDILNFKSRVSYVGAKLKNILILDVHTYDRMLCFLGVAQNVLVYSNENHNHLNERENHTFYGFYDYQRFNKKVRLKLYPQIHKTYDDSKKKKIFVSSGNSPNEIYKDVYNNDEVIYKKNTTHLFEMFKYIKEVHYLPTLFDLNNRIVVESFIHNIPFKVLGEKVMDSVQERLLLLEKGNLSDLSLDRGDTMIGDYVNVCRS